MAILIIIWFPQASLPNIKLFERIKIDPIGSEEVSLFPYFSHPKEI